MSENRTSHTRKNLLLISAIIVVALRLAVPAVDGSRVWGFDLFRYLDAWWLLAFSTLPLLAALPVAEKLFMRLFARRGLNWTYATWGGIAVLLLAAVLFPMQTFFYGDGGPLVAEVYKIGSQEHYSSAMLLNLQSAPLTGTLLHLFAVGIPAVMYPIGLTLPETPLFPFFAVSLLGVVLLGLALHIETDRRLRLPLLLLIVGTGGGLFFFTYAEMYLPVFLAATAYLLAASAALRGERPVWLAGMLLAVAVAAHYMAIALLPSLLYVILRGNAFVRKRTASLRALALSGTGIFVLAFAAYFAFGFNHSDSRVIMPLLPVHTPAGTLSYTLFSSYHLLDLANLFLLLGAFPLVLLLLVAADRRGGGGRGKTGSGKPAADSGEELRFQLIAGFSFLLFLFFANTSLGLARDWDIAAPLGVLVVMTLVEVLRGNMRGAMRDPQAVYLLQAGIVAALFAVPWIAVNVNVDASTARFAEILTLDDEHMYGDYALSGYEALRKHAVHAGDPDREEAILRRMVELVGYTEQYRMLIAGSLRHADDRPEQYMRLNSWMLDRLERTAAELRSRGLQGNYAINLKQIDSLAAVMAIESVTYGQMQNLSPRIDTFAERSGCLTARNILRGTGQYLQQEFSAAIPFFAAVRAADFRDPRVDGMYGSCQYLEGDRASGEAEFRDGLLRYDKNPQYLFMVATSYLRMEVRVAEAHALLEKALALNPPADARMQIEDILEQME
jgi:hypothetical protein